MELVGKTTHNFQRLQYLLFFVSVITLSGCNYRYSPQPISNIEIELASQSVDSDSFNQVVAESLSFEVYKNNTLIGFDETKGSFVFKITQIDSSDIKNSLLVMPHYLSKVMYFDDSFKLKDSFERNTYKPYRNFSPNIIAFNDVGKVSYILIENKASKSLYFSIEKQQQLKSYDQKLLMTFTVVYSIILTLVLVHFAFYFFIHKLGYLLYSLYIFSVLFSLLFQEGMISYFSNLSYPIFGLYTQIIWLKLTSILYWWFVLVFLELKSRSKFDNALVRFMVAVEFLIVIVLLMLFAFDVSGIYYYLSRAMNLFFVVGIIIAIYLPVKYAFLKVKQAKFLAVGVLIHMITALMRVKYSTTLEPLGFWMPRAFEFGLLFEAMVLSFGLAYKTMRVIKQRDLAERKVQQVDRELFFKELEKNFQQRTISTIDKFFRSQSELNKLINTYFTSSLRQLVEAKDIFYVSEVNKRIEVQLISGSTKHFDVKGYLAKNGDFMNKICSEYKTSFQKNDNREFSRLPFVIIPIVEKHYENLCLFLTFPTYVEVSDKMIQDFTIFANTMTLSLFTVKKYQKSIESSRYDGLTNVFNREIIQFKLDVLISASRQAKSEVSVAFIDLDDFKEINDRYGHAVGDECLIFLCNKLKTVFDRDAFVGRYGGDEFLVVFNQYSGIEIEDKFVLLYEYFASNFVKNIELNISVGIAMLQNHPSFNGKELLKKADYALYQAKKNGKNQLVFD